MDIYEVYHFLFETMPGIGCLIGGVLVISILLAFVMERRTRKKFKNREKTENDWSFFDDDDDDN